MAAAAVTVAALAVAAALVLRPGSARPQRLAAAVGVAALAGLVALGLHHQLIGRLLQLSA